MVLLGIVYPAGAGLQLFTNINTSWEWFPDNKGLVGGIMIGGYGLGVFFFGILTTSIANPDDKKTEVPKYGKPSDDLLFPLEVALRVPGMLIVVSKIGAVCSLIVILGIFRNPQAVQALEIEK